MLCQCTVINRLKTIKYMMVWYYGDCFFPLKYVRCLSTEKCYEGRRGKESRSYVSLNWPLIWGACDVENGARFGTGLWRGPSQLPASSVLSPYAPNSPSVLAAMRKSAPPSPKTPTLAHHHQKMDSEGECDLLEECFGDSLVAQWLRVTLQCRGRWSDSWSGKIPRAEGQLSPSATEPTLKSLKAPSRACALRKATSVKPEHGT